MFGASWTRQRNFHRHCAQILGLTEKDQRILAAIFPAPNYFTKINNRNTPADGCFRVQVTWVRILHLSWSVFFRILLWLVSGILCSQRGSAINVSAFAIHEYDIVGRNWNGWNICIGCLTRWPESHKNGKMHCVVTLTQIPRSRRVRNLWHMRDKTRFHSAYFDTNIQIECESVAVCKVRTNAGNNNITKSTTMNQTKNSKCGFPSAIAIKYECACVDDWDRSRNEKCNCPLNYSHSNNFPLHFSWSGPPTSRLSSPSSTQHYYHRMEYKKKTQMKTRKELHRVHFSHLH